MLRTGSILPRSLDVFSRAQYKKGPPFSPLGLFLIRIIFFVSLIPWRVAGGFVETILFLGSVKMVSQKIWKTYENEWVLYLVEKNTPPTWKTKSPQDPKNASQKTPNSSRKFTLFLNTPKRSLGKDSAKNQTSNPQKKGITPTLLMIPIMNDSSWTFEPQTNPSVGKQIYFFPAFPSHIRMKPAKFLRFFATKNRETAIKSLQTQCQNFTTHLPHLQQS